MKNFAKLARAYALKNAVAYGGKAQQGAVISALFNEGLKKEDVKKYAKKISEIVSNVNALSLKEQEKEFEKVKEIVSERKVREGLPDLPNAKKGKVVMRFAPSPSGPLHVGHIISNMISSLYVKKYGGRFYVRIEDTNPEKIMKEAYTSIKKDCDWIFGNVYEYIIQSDRMKVYYEYAEKLVRLGKVYVCTCSGDAFREFAKEGKDCPCRKLGVNENLERWKKMLDKKGYKEGTAILRFKSNMKDKNPAMRDFPLARINLAEHPRQKKKYRVWPLMNLAVPVDDIEYRMTHIIRGKDHRDNAKKQKLFYEALGLGKKFPWTAFMGRVKFTDLALSKRKITAAIEEGEYEDWDDVKLPTISSLRKRGYKPEMFAKFAEQRGLTEVDKVIDSREFFRVIDSFK